ncbi:TIGR02265 family protein [Myxococcus sp. K15C18031901]|uniref:TIGR02265 family protein n=1 Tax=Myxococcus dinghuensis TaxID=2906761 RepID=UPI0020A748F4|nr:TIGR02265 family protein [Myxococcus dinghuensis]MCP3098239.1 TIGR02265 family protein [Myxococcus dinghuensis]
MKSPQDLPLEHRFVYAQVVEGLLEHGLNGRVSPRLKARLKEAGVDLGRPLLPTYPVLLWLRCLHIIVEETWPGLPPEQAFPRLAAAHVEGYGRTLIGRAVYGVMRLLGPRRLVLRLPQTLRATDNYTRVELTEKDPTTFEMWMNSALPCPGYSETLFESLLRVGGAESPRVLILTQDDGETRYLLTWKER